LQIQKYSAIIYAVTKSFKEAIEVNEVTRDLQLPFYCLNASGTNAFFFADLATDKFEFTHKKKDAEGNENQTIGAAEGSITFKKFIDRLLNSSKDTKLTWKKRELLKEHKLQLLALVPHIIKDLGPSAEKADAEGDDAYKVALDYISKRDGLSQHLKTFTDSEALKA